MEDIEFKNIYDLYERVLPALKSKVKELKSLNIKYIKESDIFEYLTKNVWTNDNNLTLDKLVDDILMLDNNKINEFVQLKIIKNKYNEYEESERNENNI